MRDGGDDLEGLRKRVLSDAAGHSLARAIHVAVEMNLAERIGHGTTTAAELAAGTGSHPQTLGRLLHFLARHDYLDELPGGSFRLTALGTMLRRDAPGNTAAVISSLGHHGVWKAFGGLGDTVRTGLLPEHRRTPQTYNQQEGEGEARALADAMIGYHWGSPARVSACCDFASSRLVVDVGGSAGLLLTTILVAHPHLSGIVFDRPGIEAEAQRAIAAAGLSERCSFAGGSFFDGVPEGGDTYIVSRILHDWSDENAAAILASIHRAMAPGARLLIVEPLLSPDGANEDVLPVDLLLLTNTQGRLRSFEDYSELLEQSGFVPGAATPCGPTATVIDARRQ